MHPFVQHEFRWTTFYMMDSISQHMFNFFFFDLPKERILSFHINMIWIVVTIAILMLHCIINYHVDIIGENYYAQPPLSIYDIFHNFLPGLSKFVWVSDIFTMCTIIPLIIVWKTRAILDFLGFFLVIILLRTLSISLTVLPKYTECSIEYSNPITGGCYDKIFSNHTAFTLLATFIMYQYRIIRNIPLLVGLNVINVVLILLARAHYSIDIFVAIVVTILVFQNKLKIPL